jgi:predicted PurR-regulated permease PerM
MTVTIGLALCLVLIYFLMPILPPFLVGILIAYLGDPIVDRLEALKLSRTLAVCIVFLIFMILISAGVFLLLPSIIKEVVEIIVQLPTFVAWVQVKLGPVLLDKTGLDLTNIDTEMLRKSLLDNWQTAGVTVAGILTRVTRSGMALATSLANIALVPVVAFYLLRDWDIVVKSVSNLLPRHILPQTERLALECDEVLSSFLRGQLLIMLLLGTIYASGLWVVGLDMALTIGMMAGMASLVPYLGFIVGLGAATVAVLFQFHEPIYLLYVLIVFGVGQLMEGMVLTPMLMGERIGLHPVAIIFAILAGGQLFGFVGILLALPIAAVIMVFLRHIHESYKGSSLYEDVEDEI